jgi:pimeloyl-ACP methyl ester carboxylesterase
MLPDEARSLGDLAGEAAAGIAAQARDMHRGIADRVFGLLGQPAEPVRAIHDEVAAVVYGRARALTGGLVRGGGFAYGLTQPSDAPGLEDTPGGRLAVGALNGAWGDRLAARRSALAREMSVRRGGRDLSVDATSLARAIPDARPRLAVFVHGLCETDDAWRLRASRSLPYGDALEAEHGYTAVYVRYNSGLHISVNGRRLAALLGELCAAWPVELTEVALIGHSMGGLLARSACHYAPEGSWRELVRHVFLLGTPHKGAPLELAANAACHGLSRLPETRPLATPLRARAAGVKDLGFGYVIDEDWTGHDPDAFRHNTGTVVPFLTSANHYFMSATLTREADARLGRWIGDLLVLRPSAWSHDGRGERLQFPIDRYSHIGRATHFDLLNHPAIWAQIEKWLTAGRELPVSAGVS